MVSYSGCHAEFFGTPLCSIRTVDWFIASFDIYHTKWLRYSRWALCFWPILVSIDRAERTVHEYEARFPPHNRFSGNLHQIWPGVIWCVAATSRQRYVDLISMARGFLEKTDVLRKNWLHTRELWAQSDQKRAKSPERKKGYLLQFETLNVIRKEYVNCIICLNLTQIAVSSTICIRIILPNYRATC